MLHIELTDWEPDRDFDVVWMDNTLATLAALDFKRDCSRALERPVESQHKIAAQLELLYGAPHKNYDDALLEAGPFKDLCSFSDALHMSQETRNLRYVELPTYPKNIPEDVRSCIEQLKKAR